MPPTAEANTLPTTPAILIADDDRDVCAIVVEEFQRLGMDAARARTLRTWADALRKGGEAGVSAELWRQARAIFERLGMQRELEWTIANEAGWTRS